MYFLPCYVRANVLKFANSPTGHKKSFKDRFSQQQMGTLEKLEERGKNDLETPVSSTRNKKYH